MHKNKFDNRINVINISGQPQHPTYLHRAKGLVKNGRAEWVDQKTIRILITQSITQSFAKFMNAKKKSQSYIDKIIGLFNTFESMLENRQVTAAIIKDFLNYIECNGIKGDGTGRGSGAVKAGYQFLDEYTAYCGEESLFAEVYYQHILNAFELPIKTAVDYLKKAIVFIPEDTIIDPYYLDGLTNEEFVTAFKSLQEFLYTVYAEIGRTSPFLWGWSSSAKDTSCYGINPNRVMDTLRALAECGDVNRDVLTVCKKTFSGTKAMLDGFTDMGLFVEGFGTKDSDTFTVSYPDTPNLITVLKAYFKVRRRECCKCHTSDVYPCMDNCDVRNIRHHFNFGIFSYRFVEQHNVHDTEVFVLAFTDSAPDELRKILRYLHEQAAIHEFAIAPWTTCHNGCIRYWRGMKTWLTVGSGTYWGDAFYSMQSGEWSIKPLPDKPVLFQRIFTKHPEKAAELVRRFPKAFENSKINCKNCVDGKCKHQIQKWCAKSIRFDNPSLDDAKFILELYKLENNIKPI